MGTGSLVWIKIAAVKTNKNGNQVHRMAEVMTLIQALKPN
jgi:hypothetical protein